MGHATRRFPAAPDSTQRPTSVHGDPRRPAAVLSHAGHVPVEFAPAGVSGDRTDGLGQMRVLRRRVHPQGLGFVLGVGFFLDDARTQFQVDAPLDGGAFVVLEVDGARQPHEFRAEILGPFLSRMSSSITQRRSLTLCRASTSAATSTCRIRRVSARFARAQPVRHARSLSLTGSVMRCDLMRRIVTLSSSSPGDTGTLISLVIGGIHRSWEAF
jgi:hypothetical protein